MPILYTVHRILQQFSGLCTLIFCLKFFINSYFKIKNKSGTMSGRRSGSVTADENVAKRPRKYVTLEQKMEVLKRMEGGQSRPTVCTDLNKGSSAVTTIMESRHQAKQTTTPLSYSKRKS
jgi:hypothetical protein